MANVKISALPAAVAASGTDVVPVVQGTTTKKLSMSRLLTSPTLFAPGMSTFFATPSSANLRGVLTDETGTGSAVFADAPALTAPTISGGDMEFSSLGQRIKGDLTTTTVSNRLLFQTSTVNGTTSVGAIPDGTATTAGFAAANSSDANNASIAILQATPTVVSVTATKTGTGSFLPLTFVTSTIERLRIDTSGNVNIPTAGARITGDFSGVTVANRLAFQTSTVNGNTSVAAIPNGTSVQANIRAFANSDPTNASFTDIGADPTVGSFLRAERAGTGTYLPLTFYTGGNERVRVDTSGNVGIGTASPVNKVDVSGGNFGFRAAAQARFYRPDNGNYAIIDNPSNYLRLSQSGGDDVIVTTSGNVGIGTTSPSQLVEASLSQNGKTQVKVTNVNAGANTSAGVLFGTSSGDNGYIGANGGAASSAIGGANAVQVTNLTANPVVLATNNTERMRIDSSGNIVAGASAALATNATNGFLYVPTCAGTPTGVPTAITGMAPIVVNTTNNKLYFYSGGAWRDAGP